MRPYETFVRLAEGVTVRGVMLEVGVMLAVGVVLAVGPTRV